MEMDAQDGVILKGAMHMRKFFMTAFALSAVLVLASSSFALERTTIRATDDLGNQWNAGSTCNVSYYNVCTGWLWVWSGWVPGDGIGVCITSCCPGQTQLTQSTMDVISAAPPGYGFTGTIQVNAADANCCPTGAPIQQQAWLPVTRLNTYAWNANVPSNFVISVTFGPATDGNLNKPATDHPAAGPTGPQPCGACYPATRVNHSFAYPAAAPCPGSAFFDGVCNAELEWTASLSCEVAVEPESWGNIKNLYR